MATYTDISRQVAVPGGSAFSMGLLDGDQAHTLRELLAALNKGDVGSFGPGFNVQASQLEQTSLDALEQRAMNLEMPSELDNAVTAALMRALEANPQNIDQFFEQSIQNPALRSFNEDVLPQIGRNFGGADFFSSERAQTDQRAQRELVESLTRSRSQIQFEAYEAAQNRALQAAGVATARDNQDFQEEMALFGAGQSLTNRAIGERDKEYAEFVRQQDERARQRQQQLTAISIPTKENIVAQKGPKQKSDIGGILSGVGAIIGGIAMFSDRNMKEDIEPVDTPILDALKKLPISRWTYKDDPAKKRHIGPMAQDFQAAFGVGDGKTIDLVDVVGVMLTGLKELSEVR